MIIILAKTPYFKNVLPSNCSLILYNSNKYFQQPIVSCISSIRLPDIEAFKTTFFLVCHFCYLFYFRYFITNEQTNNFIISFMVCQLVLRRFSCFIDSLRLIPWLAFGGYKRLELNVDGVWMNVSRKEYDESADFGICQRMGLPTSVTFLQ